MFLWITSLQAWCAGFSKSSMQRLGGRWRNSPISLFADCLTTALQLCGVWEEMAAGAWEGGSQSFLLVGTRMRAVEACMLCLSVGKFSIYLFVFNGLGSLHLNVYKSRTDESESYLKCLLFMRMTCLIFLCSRQFDKPHCLLKSFLLDRRFLWNYVMTEILGLFNPLFCESLQLAFM